MPTHIARRRWPNTTTASAVRRHRKELQMRHDEVRDLLLHHLRYSGVDNAKAHEIYHHDAILEFPQSGLCWRIHTGEGTSRSLVRRETQLPPRGVPVSQASTRTRLRASAIRTFCRWVLGRPR
jgi:hypothetical protein